MNTDPEGEHWVVVGGEVSAYGCTNLAAYAFGLKNIPHFLAIGQELVEGLLGGPVK